MSAKNHPYILAAFILAMQAFIYTPAFSQQVLPSAADAARIRPDTLPPLLPPTGEPIQVPTAAPITGAPTGSEGVYLTLQAVQIKGATAFPASALADIYEPFLGQRIQASKIWEIAGAITERYRNQGYFLSRAYVPEQNITNGNITINVVEGFIGKVVLSDDIAKTSVIKKSIAKLTAQKPLKTQALEEFLLRLNDLPGLNFRAILQPVKPGEGEIRAVALVLVPIKKAVTGSLGFDNYGSRFLGPYEANASLQASLLPLQRTSLSFLNSAQTRELTSIGGSHEIVLEPKLNLVLDGSFTKANPGYTLEPLEIDSRSKNLGIALRYQPLRQRSENLSFTFKTDARNTASDILKTPLTRDRVRAARVSASYDHINSWNGFSAAELKLSQGLSILNASHSGDLNLSRAEAKPDFQKAELALSYLQGLNPEWSMLANFNGQIASGPLYSSEEFGYGGSSIGRAFDASEITGDHGAKGLLELRYNGFSGNDINITPYIFYDIGRVWNEDASQRQRETGTSGGGGFYLNAASAIIGHFAIAQPLTRAAANPIYGTGGSPRYLFSLEWHY